MNSIESIDNNIIYLPQFKRSAERSWSNDVTGKVVEFKPKNPKLPDNVIYFPTMNPPEQEIKIDQGKTETASPFFTTDKYPPYVEQTEAQFGEEQGAKIIKLRIARDIESQLWELREGELPYTYMIYLKNINGENLMVHESDLSTMTDLPNGVSEQIRKGVEKRQILMAKKRLFEAAPGTTLIVPSPKMYERDETSMEAPYVDSIVTIMQKVDDESVFCRQILIKKDTPNFAAPEMADLINELNGVNIADRNAHISLILMAIAEIPHLVSNTTIWEAIEKITGQPFLSKPVDQLKAEEEKFIQYSTEGSEYLYSVLKAGLRGTELESQYNEMMKTYLDGVTSGKIQRDSSGGVTFITSCGVFGMAGTRNGVQTENGKQVLWCEDCKEKNTCNTDYCYKPHCRGKLTDKKPVSPLSNVA